MNEDLLMLWVSGLIAFMGELLIIMFPAAVPFIGPIYQSYLGRALGFPDEKLDRAVDSIFSKSDK